MEPSGAPTDVDVRRESPTEDALPGLEGQGPGEPAGEQNERRQRIMALKQELVGGDLLSAAEVAEILDIHPRTVGEYIREGKLRAFQLGGGWKISEGALRAFVREQTQAPTQAPPAPPPPASPAETTHPIARALNDVLMSLVPPAETRGDARRGRPADRALRGQGQGLPLLLLQARPRSACGASSPGPVGSSSATSASPSATPSSARRRSPARPRRRRPRSRRPPSGAAPHAVRWSRDGKRDAHRSRPASLAEPAPHPARERDLLCLRRRDRARRRRRSSPPAPESRPRCC